MYPKEDYFAYLDYLRKSGIVNMFAATPYIMRNFNILSYKKADEILKEWINTFEERHPGE